jgi:hypothetical protein
MAESTQQLAGLRLLSSADAEAAARFLSRLPEGDLTFLKEPLDEDTVSRWLSDERTHRWVPVGADGELQAMLGVSIGAL